MKNSYLETIQNMHIDRSTLDIAQKVSKYSTYEQYLHQRSKHKHQNTEQPEVKVIQYKETTINPPQNDIHSTEIKYYPIKRTVIDYENKECIEKIPKIKKFTQYIEKKTIESIPKEVTHTDYYAVQHLRQYYKQVVPEVRTEIVKVPKTIKRTEAIPLKKQIIYYPSHMTCKQDIQKQAKQNLEKMGVVISQTAEYRPITEKPYQQHVIDSGSEHKKTQFILKNELHEPIKLEKQIPSNDHQLQTPFFNPNGYIEKISYNSKALKMVQKTQQIPTYDVKKYNFESKDEFLPTSSNLEPSDYSLSQKNKYRYDLAMYNTAKRLK